MPLVCGLAPAEPPTRPIAAVGKPPRMPTDTVGFRSTTLRLRRLRCHSAIAPVTTACAMSATALGP